MCLNSYFKRTLLNELVMDTKLFPDIIYVCLCYFCVGGKYCCCGCKDYLPLVFRLWINFLFDIGTFVYLSDQRNSEEASEKRVRFAIVAFLILYFFCIFITSFYVVRKMFKKNDASNVKVIVVVFCLYKFFGILIDALTLGYIGTVFDFEEGLPIFSKFDTISGRDWIIWIMSLISFVSLFVNFIEFIISVKMVFKKF